MGTLIRSRGMVLERQRERLVLRTRFTELVGCEVPVQMAGMGSLARPALAAAVANAGALGMLGWVGAPPAYIERMFAETRSRTKGPVGMNFITDGWVDPSTGDIDADGIAAVRTAAPLARVVEFFYSDPHPDLVQLVHDGGALAAWQVGSREEAVAAERAGCDLVIAQGVEAGGHVRGTRPLSALLHETCAAVRIPVVAAGGIGSGSAVAVALKAGAAGVRIGTRLVAALESEAHPAYVARLVEAEATDTVLTEVFSTNWPHAPHRVLRGCVEELSRVDEDIVGQRTRPWNPQESVPIHRGDAIVPLADTTGRIEAMPHWAGESVGGVRGVKPAAAIIDELLSEAKGLEARR